MREAEATIENMPVFPGKGNWKGWARGGFLTSFSGASRGGCNLQNGAQADAAGAGFAGGGGRVEGKDGGAFEAEIGRWRWV